jgi:hypothetical protein
VARPRTMIAVWVPSTTTNYVTQGTQVAINLYCQRSLIARTSTNRPQVIGSGLTVLSAGPTRPGSERPSSLRATPIHSWGGSQWVATRRILPSQAHGSVFTVRDLWGGGEATGAGGGESSWRPGPGSLLGTGSWVGLDGAGARGRSTTAGRVAAWWRTAGAASETGWTTTAGGRSAPGGFVTTGWVGAAGWCCAGAGCGAGTRFGCWAAACWLTGLACGTSGSTGGVRNIPAVAAASPTTVTPLATRATTVLRRLSTIPPTPCQRLYCH